MRAVEEAKRTKKEEEEKKEKQRNDTIFQGFLKANHFDKKTDVLRETEKGTYIFRNIAFLKKS